MRTKNKVYLVFILVCFCSCLLFQVNCFGEAEGFFYPPRTKLVERESKKYGGLVDTTFDFSSQLSKEEIVDFYRNLFVSQGLKEDKEITKSKYLAPFNKDNTMFVFNNGLLKMVTLVIYHHDEDKDINYYILNDAEFKYVLDLSSDNSKKPKKLKDVPVDFKTKEIYPREEETQGKQVSHMYLASNTLEDSINFYQNQMPSFGWKLVDKKSHQGSYNLMVITSKNKDYSIAEMPKKAKELLSDIGLTPRAPEELYPGMDVVVEGETLIFKKQNKECKIVINQLKDTAEVLKQKKIVNPEYSKEQGDILISVFYDR